MYARVRKALPELYAFTVCMWLRSRSGGTGQGTPFSYSVPGQANEIVLLEAGHDPMELLINDKVSRPGSGGGGGTLPGAPALHQVPKWVGVLSAPAQQNQHTWNVEGVPGWALGTQRPRGWWKWSLRLREAVSGGVSFTGEHVRRAEIQRPLL